MFLDEPGAVGEGSSCSAQVEFLHVCCDFLSLATAARVHRLSPVRRSIIRFLCWHALHVEKFFTSKVGSMNQFARSWILLLGSTRALGFAHRKLEAHEHAQCSVLVCEPDSLMDRVADRIGTLESKDDIPPFLRQKQAHFALSGTRLPQCNRDKFFSHDPSTWPNRERAKASTL